MVPVGVVCGFGLIDDEFGWGVIAKARQIHWGSGASSRPGARLRRGFGAPGMEPLGVVGIDGGAIVNGKTRIPPRKEQVDALLGDELAVSKKSQNLMPEDELDLMGVDLGDGLP